MKSGKKFILFLWRRKMERKRKHVKRARPLPDNTRGHSCFKWQLAPFLRKNTKLFLLKLINTSERVAYFTKIAGKRRRLVQQQTNKRQISMSYQQQYVCSRRKASKTIVIRLYLDLLCVFSALVNSAAGTRLRI